jgi:hypothetical protein
MLFRGQYHTADKPKASSNYYGRTAFVSTTLCCWHCLEGGVYLVDTPCCAQVHACNTSTVLLVHLCLKLASK